MPATVWAPPPDAVGQAWRPWLIGAVRRAFLPHGGRYLDLTVQLRPGSESPACDHVPSRRGLTVVPFWANLIADPASGHAQDLTVATPTTPDPSPEDPLVTSADLVFADLDDAPVDDRLGVLAARAIRAGGILAVLTRCRHTANRADGAELIDPSGLVVASAQNADLLYLQHIVIPRHPLTPPAPEVSETEAQPHYDDPATRRRHRIAHADLLVFARSGYAYPDRRDEQPSTPAGGAR